MKKKSKVIPSLSAIKFLRKKTRHKNTPGKAETINYAIEFILTNTVVTETFKNKKERDGFYESVRLKLNAIADLPVKSNMGK